MNLRRHVRWGIICFGMLLVIIAALKFFSLDVISLEKYSSSSRDTQALILMLLFGAAAVLYGIGMEGD